MSDDRRRTHHRRTHRNRGRVDDTRDPRQGQEVATHRLRRAAGPRVRPDAALRDRHLDPQPGHEHRPLRRHRVAARQQQGHPASRCHSRGDRALPERRRGGRDRKCAPEASEVPRGAGRERDAGLRHRRHRADPRVRPVPDVLGCREPPRAQPVGRTARRRPGQGAGRGVDQGRPGQARPHRRDRPRQDHARRSWSDLPPERRRSTRLADGHDHRLGGVGRRRGPTSASSTRWPGCCRCSPCCVWWAPH